jgi:hypothetical protein
MTSVNTLFLYLQLLKEWNKYLQAVKFVTICDKENPTKTGMKSDALKE